MAAEPSAEDDSEYEPLPFYPWDERPGHVDISMPEAETALHLSKGSLSRAAGLLKVSLLRLSKLLQRSPHLMRIYREHAQAAVYRAADEYIHALHDPDSDNRRREAAAAKILASRAAASMDSPYAPAGPNATIGPASGGRIVISWEGEDENGEPAGSAPLAIEGSLAGPGDGGAAGPEGEDPI